MNNILHITIIGKPVPKKRARKGACGNFHNPSRSDMDKAVKELKKQIPDEFEPIKKGEPVIVNACFFIKPAKSQQTKKFVDLISDECYPYTKKGDIDNLFKFTMEILSETIMHDDNQIYSANISKHYSMNERTEIEVKW